ncbi:hypothetical protein [Mesorhizobium sp.]|uniref:hypothetical protein n=1 Tax=Mesorhizobium sp. TaxID=1871066 RepID=UPI0025DA7B79|nr:hypothetical protein [Mesorhizobium sp.]
MRPDFVTIAKGLSSAYLPISGSIIGDRVWSVLEQGTEKHGALGHGWTYSGHTLCAAAALANIRLLKRKKYFGACPRCWTVLARPDEGRAGGTSHRW